MFQLLIQGEEELRKRQTLSGIIVRVHREGRKSLRTSWDGDLASPSRGRTPEYRG